VFISKLKIHNFRNIKFKEFEFSQQINIFHGNNGVGKTSILEAIHFLSSGKSFRKGNFKTLINFNSDNLTVYLECLLSANPSSISVNKSNNGKWKGKINNTYLNKQFEITNILPVVSIDPEVYRLVDFGPLYRRNFLDWLVFHVKHDYLLLWKKVYKCIKQLNLLYKSKAHVDQIELWESTFVDLSIKLNNVRENVFLEILPNIYKLSSFMQEEINNLCVEFKKGWSKDISLKEQMTMDRKKNLLYGQLQHGPHKMDIKINTGTQQASQTLSRGQKKLLSITFYMAYIQYLNLNDVNPILCLDDFDAEIDKDKLFKSADFFKKTTSQIFITSVQKNKIYRAFPKAELFHVKH